MTTSSGAKKTLEFWIDSIMQTCGHQCVNHLVVAEDIVDFNELSNEEGQHQG